MVSVEGIIGSTDWGGLTFGFLKWILWPLLLVGLVWVIHYYLSYNIRVNIFNPHGKFSIKETDRARAMRDRKTKMVKRHVLMKNKKDWEGMIPGNFFVPVKGTFNRLYYEVNLIRDSEKNLQPIAPPKSSDVTAWEGMSSSDIQWALNEIEEGHSVYMKQSFWMQHGGTIVAIGGFLVVGVIMLVLFKQLDVLAAAFNNAADKASEAIIAANSQVIR